MRALLWKLSCLFRRGVKNRLCPTGAVAGLVRTGGEVFSPDFSKPSISKSEIFECPEKRLRR
jgi:hypothetical protein